VQLWVPWAAMQIERDSADPHQPELPEKSRVSRHVGPGNVSGTRYDWNRKQC
jgi:hypothetical protein